MLKKGFLFIAFSALCYGLDFGLNVANPISLEESLKLTLNINCQHIEHLKHQSLHFKDNDAKTRCTKEQNIIKAIINDDVKAYENLQKDESIKLFLFFTTNPPSVEITPLMASIAFNSKLTFHHILRQSGKITLFAKIFHQIPQYDINRVMLDELNALGAFTLNSQIYDVNGLNALDLSAMYHRYDMFSALLKAKADYHSHKHPQNSGIVTFGDEKILEIMLSYDKKFLSDFSGGKILHFAARNGNVELINYLITQKNMPINLLKASETPLDAALSGKNFENKPKLQAAKRLIELGAKVSSANAHRLSTLQSQ